MYRLHSPFVFDLANAVLEDDRLFYAFKEVEHVRSIMLRERTELSIRDYGAGPSGTLENQSAQGYSMRKAAVKDIAKRAGSSPRQGRMLFRLINHLGCRNLLELGSSVGLGTMYIASAARLGNFIALEGDPQSANVAQLNLEILHLKNVEFGIGPFSETLKPALDTLKTVDFAFFDGNHQKQPTIDYFETALAYAHSDSVFVFDDIFWSEGMLEAWESIKAHPKVTLTIDFLDFSLAFFSPNFKEKQHFSIVPKSWKPWMF